VNLAISLAESKNPPMVALMDMNLLSGKFDLFKFEFPLQLGRGAKNISRADATYLMSILSNTARDLCPSIPTGIDGINVANADVY